LRPRALPGRECHQYRETGMSAVLQLPSTAEVEAIGKELLSRVTAKKAMVGVQCTVSGSTSFSRNEIYGVDGASEITISLFVDLDGRGAYTYGNRTDVEGLAQMVADTESMARQNHGSAGAIEFYPPRPFTDVPLYFDSSVAAGDPEFQAAAMRESLATIRQAGMVGAGNFGVHLDSYSLMNTLGMKAHSRDTNAAFSVTARTVSGKGSGWAQGNVEDFGKLDLEAITATAVDIARRSENPVAVEPGRYTVILEPDAVGQLVSMLFSEPTRYLSLEAAENGESVFSHFEGKTLKGSKLGMRMTDPRVQLFSDPNDRLRPLSHLAPFGMMLQPTQWIEDGVLKALAYDVKWGRRHTLAPQYLVNPQTGNLEVSGPTQSLEDMIAGTRRGIWVRRFSGLSMVNRLSLLLSGITRDGAFLIENGKITKPIKNLRFLESPFFILNKLETAGATVRAGGVACPRLKVRDFEFTSLSDAI
jgi:predicted Zn-dependent protease